MSATDERLDAQRLDPMRSIDRQRIDIAARRARTLYPGPVGELLSRELEAWAHHGFRVRFDNGLMARVVAAVEALPLTEGPS